MINFEGNFDMKTIEFLLEKIRTVDARLHQNVLAALLADKNIKSVC